MHPEDYSDSTGLCFRCRHSARACGSSRIPSARMLPSPPPPPPLLLLLLPPLSAPRHWHDGGDRGRGDRQGGDVGTGNRAHPNRVACTTERGDKRQGQCSTPREERWRRKSRRRRWWKKRRKRGGSGGSTFHPVSLHSSPPSSLFVSFLLFFPPKWLKRARHPYVIHFGYLVTRSGVRDPYIALGELIDLNLNILFKILSLSFIVIIYIYRFFFTKSKCWFNNLSLSISYQFCSFKIKLKNSDSYPR